MIARPFWMVVSLTGDQPCGAVWGTKSTHSIKMGSIINFVCCYYMCEVSADEILGLCVY